MFEKIETLQDEKLRWRLKLGSYEVPFPIEISVAIDIYCSIVLIVSFLLLSFLSPLSRGGAFGVALIFSIIFAIITYQWVRKLVYCILPRKIPFQSYLKKTLIKKLSENRPILAEDKKEFERAMKIIKQIITVPI